LRRLQADFDPRSWSRAITYFSTSEWVAIEDLLQTDASPTDDEKDAWPPDDVGENARRVPCRMYPGPVWERSLLRYRSPDVATRLRELQKAHKDLPRIVPTIALYWADGQRTLAEIVNLVELETGARAAAYLAGYFEILAELGAVEW